MSEQPMVESDAVPRLRDGIDLTRTRLSPEEGFLVSRVDGRTKVSELALLVGKPPDEVRQVVSRLVSSRILVLAGQTADLDAWDGFRFPAGALAEDVDLNDEEKKRILFTHGHLEDWTHYELLGARWRDDAKAIKAAYFERSREWHPDRFRRTKLGSYEARINDIFKALNTAYSVLSKPDTKAAYDRENAPAFDEEDMAEMLAAQRREARDAEREAAKKRRRLERNPLRRRFVQAKEMYAQALDATEKGDHMEGLRLVQAALAFHDKDEYRALKNELQRSTAEQRVAPLIRRGQNAESMTSWEDAIQMFREAVRLAPEHGQARLRLGYNLLMGKHPVQEANEHVQKAVRLLPNDPEAHYVLALCYVRGDMAKLAIRALEKSLELKPNYSEAKKLQKKLRWGF